MIRAAGVEGVGLQGHGLDRDSAHLAGPVRAIVEAPQRCLDSGQLGADLLQPSRIVCRGWAGDLLSP